MKKQFMAALLATTAWQHDLLAKEVEKTTVELSVTEKGFEPKAVDVKPGSNVVLKIIRKTDTTCAKQIQIPSKKVKMDLPLNRSVEVALGKLKNGEIRFGCGMDMMESGRIVVR